METGTRLPNNAIVMEVSGEVILAKGDRAMGMREYITWRWDQKDPASTCHGHYFTNLREAAADFDGRVAAMR